jgi:hypothetical protein
MILAFFFGLNWSVSTSIAASPVLKTPVVGWSGQYVVGRWTPVAIPVVVDTPTTVQLELTAVDSDGNRVGFLSPKVDLHQGENQLSGLIKVGRLDGEIGVRIDGTNEIRGLPGRTEWLRDPLKPSSRLIVTVGDPKGFDFEAESQKNGVVVKIVPTTPEQLPTNPLAFDSVFSLVVAGSPQISAAQSEALRDWVAAGGRLVVSLKHDSDAANRVIQQFQGWFPVSLGEQPVTVREFGGLESFAGKNLRIPLTKTLSIPSLKLDTGEVLATSRSDAFLVRAPYGLGTVTVLAMDLTSAPLTEWKALTSFCERLSGVVATVDAREKVVIKSAQISTTGISDLATQLNATQDSFESVFRASPWFVIGLLSLLLIVVGPIDYLIVHRLLKLPHLTWVTFPLLVTACAWLASTWATSANGSSRLANQLDIVNVDVSTSRAWGRHFITLYSPTTTQTSIAVQPIPLTKVSKTAPSARVSWHGVPESSFGGMLRPTGFEQGAKYQELSDGTISQLPLMQWSSKALVANSLQSVEGLIDADLRASPTGRLTGTLTHRFSSPIEDWMIVYKNVVYRHLKKKDDTQPLPFPPNQVWRVEQPSVFSRELKPYLTGMITMATPRFGETTTMDYTHHQTTYDPLSLDPAHILRVLTFHDEIGGERYTRLTNQILNDEDFSQLHRLGRAILVGRLGQPVASIQQDHETFEPTRQASFVRLILPVARPTEVLKHLQRVVPDQ